MADAAPTQDASDNINIFPSPQVVSHDYIDARDSIAGGQTPRTLPRQILTGSQRGDWNITGSISILDPSISTNTNQGSIKLDGTSNAILVTNTDGSVVGMGELPDGSGFGFFAQDASGNLLYKIVGSTIYAYDITQSPATNVMQILELPDGTYGWAVANTGKNVSDGFSQ